MSTILLQTENLTTGYVSKNTQVIVSSNVSIQLKKSKLIALIGANGIGKSTLLRTLTGIQKPLLGTVILNDTIIEKYSTLALAQNISVVLTEKLPPSNLTVFELVALGRQPHTNWLGALAAADLEKIENAISLTQIKSIAHKKHFEISDGQLQKALIARALAQDAPLIILDEPTTHLDLVNKVSLLKLLKQLTQQTDKCILFSSHDIDMALQIADELIVITPTKVHQDTPSNLIHSGILNQLFNDAAVTFDKTKGKFIFK